MKRAFLTMATLLLGCQTDYQYQGAGMATASLSQVPAMVQCIRIVVTGGERTAERKFPVTPGQPPSVLSMSGLPTGAVTFVGDAFPGQCGSVTAASAPTWSTDPTAEILSAGSMSTVELIFKRTSNVNIGIDFVDDAGTKMIDGGGDGGTLGRDGGNGDGGTLGRDGGNGDGGTLGRDGGGNGDGGIARDGGGSGNGDGGGSGNGDGGAVNFDGGQMG